MKFPSHYIISVNCDWSIIVIVHDLVPGIFCGGGDIKVVWPPTPSVLQYLVCCLLPDLIRCANWNSGPSRFWYFKHSIPLDPEAVLWVHCQCSKEVTAHWHCIISLLYTVTYIWWEHCGTQMCTFSGAAARQPVFVMIVSWCEETMTWKLVISIVVSYLQWYCVGMHIGMVSFLSEYLISDITQRAYLKILQYKIHKSI